VKIAVVEWLRMQPVGVEIVGLNLSVFFPDIFVHLFIIVSQQHELKSLRG